MGFDLRNLFCWLFCPIVYLNRQFYVFYIYISFCVLSKNTKHYQKWRFFTLVIFSNIHLNIYIKNTNFEPKAMSNRTFPSIKMFFKETQVKIILLISFSCFWTSGWQNFDLRVTDSNSFRHRWNQFFSVARSIHAYIFRAYFCI